MQRGIWKLGCLEAWMLGGAPEVEARAAALGGDETERCAAITVQAQRAKPSTAKDTKNHEGHKEHVAGAGRACARGTRPARRACRGMAGFARHALVFGESSGDSPVLLVLYVLYVLPRRPLARRRRAGGAGAVGSLEAWMLGSLVSLHNDCFVARLPRALFSVFCSLFSGAR